MHKRLFVVFDFTCD